MKETVQEAAKEMCEAWGMEDNHGYSVKDTFQVGFVQGSNWRAEQSPWIRTEDKMPEDNELVLTSSSIYGTKLLVWNEFHKVWDDEDGDDTYCDRDKIDAWMPIPE